MKNAARTNQSIAEEMVSLLPKDIGSFKGSQFPLPVRTTFLGDKPLDLPALAASLKDKAKGDIKNLVDPLLLAAEAFESTQPDRDQFFITDRMAQKLVFRGSKWKAGWVLLLGGADNQALIKELLARDFMVFTDQPDIPETQYIGSRATSPIYFLQLMVRYGLVWGRIAPGDDHQMGHFLEVDLPGFMIIRADLPPLKYAVALGLMKLGCPAVVPSSFPFPYGNRIVADTDDGILDASGSFPNLRKKYFDGETITLPSYANQAFASEEFIPEKTIGGTADSFFCVRPARSAEGEAPVEAGGPAVEGPASPADGTIPPVGGPVPPADSPLPTRAQGLGILIEIDEQGFTDDIAWVVEKAALKSLSFLEGHKASVENAVFSLALSRGVSHDESRIREVLHWGIRLQYPRIKRIAITMLRDEGQLALWGPRINAYKEQRKASIDAMTEENTDVLCACTECRPFSLVHTCILTPDRTPMCGARTYFTVKASSLFGSDLQPHKRERERDLPLRSTFLKGRVLDAMRGEYEGCNLAYQRMTHGTLTRVFLHSLRDSPQTSCGCFGNLAFLLKGFDGIGVMKRGSQAMTPDGRNWETLANEAGGKQTPGILGVSFDYIRSNKFLKGDGGIGKVVWMDSDLLRRVGDRLLPGQRVATEKDVTTIEELEKFLRQ